MSRRLHLATLEDMENHPPSQPTQSQTQSRGSGVAPARLSLSHQHVGQIKYNISDTSPLIDRVAFKAYLAIFRWFKRHFNFITLTQLRVDPDGTEHYGSLEHQGCFADEASAKQDAARYPFGFVVPVPMGRSYPSDTIEGDYEFPNKEGAMLTHWGLVKDEARKLRAAVHSARNIQ